jgi:hypothetical protein
MFFSDNILLPLKSVFINFFDYEELAFRQQLLLIFRAPNNHLQLGCSHFKTQTIEKFYISVLTSKNKYIRLIVEKYINLIQHHNISVVMIVDMYMNYFYFIFRTFEVIPKSQVFLYDARYVRQPNILNTVNKCTV